MKFPRATRLQSILFDRTKWTVTRAREWLRAHKKRAPISDSTDRYHRFRQLPPDAFEKDKFRTITLSAEQGIKAVIGVPKLKKNGTINRKRKSPWIPTTLVDIAVPISIDLEGDKQLSFKRSGKFALCSNASGTELWIISKRRSKRVDSGEPDEKSEKLYESFTGFEHDSIADLVNISPKKMMRIGRAMDIVYRSDKFSKPGDTSDYVHAFSTYPTVSADSATKPTIVALRGGRIRVKKEGITG